MRSPKAQSLAEFGEMLYPDQAQEPILAKSVRDALTEWLTEIWAKEDLEKVGLKPRQKALFVGPPGTGKTTLAHHLAARLKLPMAVVRSDRLIASYVGETDQNIGMLFDLASQSEKCVLFIDEFDSLGLSRRKAQQGADDARNSMVNMLLQRMEHFDGFMIAATNRGEELDQAIWRRFDLQIKLALPGLRERELILSRYLAPYSLPAQSLTEFATAFADASPALMRQFCEGLKRQFVIGPKVLWDMEMNATINRLLAAIEPHPDLPRPRLWDRRANDVSLRELPWPFPIERKPEAKKARAA
jgi:SpoVK/Ycf46/Vps4 family AAA+-type ATPase